MAVNYDGFAQGFQGGFGLMQTQLPISAEMILKRND